MTSHRRSRYLILITDVHELAGLGAARALGRAGYRAVGTVPVAELHGAGAGSRHLSEVVAAPSAGADFLEFRDWLRQYCKTHDVSAVLPIAAASQLAARQLADDGELSCPVIAPTGPLLELTQSNYLATQATARLGLAVPPTWYLCDGTRHDAEQLRALRLPCLLRSDPTISTRGEYLPGQSWEATTLDDCTAVVDECLSIGARLIAQEVAPGRNVAALCLRWRNALVLQAAANPSTLADAERLLLGIAYEGVALVEFRENDAAPPWFFAITNALSTSHALCAGTDLPTALVDLALDDRTSVRAPALPHRVRSANCGAHYFSWTDPSPGLRQARRLIARLGRNAADGASRLLSVGSSRMLSLTAQPQQITRARNILVLCRGNLCRSPFAAALLARRLAEGGGAPIEVRSAGLETPGGERSPERFGRLFERFGVRLDAHCSRSVTAADVASADLVVLMDTRNLASLYRRFRPALVKTLMLGALDADAADVEITDPVTAPAPQAAKVYARIAACAAVLAAQLRGAAR